DELKQISGVVSGPIIADRLHYLASVEHSDQHRESLITSPLAGGTYTGAFNQTLAMLRLDDELGAANHLMFRANLDRLDDSNPQDVVGGLTLPSAGRTFRRHTTSKRAARARQRQSA